MNVCLLEGLHTRVERKYLIIEDRFDRNVTNIVLTEEWMSLNVIGRRAEVQSPTVEEHHRDIDPLPACRNDALAEPVEVGRVERVKVELRRAIPCVSSACSWPRLRRHTEMETASCSLRLELLPTPEPDEVVVMLLQELEIGVVINLLRSFSAIWAGSHTIVEVIPDVRAGQVDRFLIGVGCDREIAGICR